MYRPQPIEPVTPRLRIRPGAQLTALAVLVAIAVTIMFITRTGTNHHTTVAIPRRPRKWALAPPRKRST